MAELQTAAPKRAHDQSPSERAILFSVKEYRQSQRKSQNQIKKILSALLWLGGLENINEYSVVRADRSCLSVIAIVVFVLN
jgi:hypothetical protein